MNFWFEHLKLLRSTEIMMMMMMMKIQIIPCVSRDAEHVATLFGPSLPIEMKDFLLCFFVCFHHICKAKWNFDRIQKQLQDKRCVC